MSGTSKYGKLKPGRIITAPDPDPDATALETSLGEIGVAVIETDATGKVIRLNATAERITGWSALEAKGEPLGSVFKLVRPPKPALGDDEVIERGGSEKLALRMKALFSPDRTGILARRDGEVVPVRHAMTEAQARSGAPAGRHVFFRDLSAEQLLSLQLLGRSDTDPLTGLLTRKALEERIVRSGTPRFRHALIWIDLDRFRLVNVTCGHDAGDELLHWVGTRLHESLGPQDCAARIGADEFVVLLSDRPEDELEKVARDLRQRLWQYRFGWGDKSFGVPASLGLIFFGHGSEHSSELLRSASAACDKAKVAGGARLHVLDMQDSKAAHDRRSMDWVASLQRNLEQGRLLLYAQGVHPLQPHAAKEGAHFEVLVRQVAEDGKHLSPVRIIEAAENVGLMDAIDRFVITQTLETLAGLPKTTMKKIGVAAINLSGISLLGQDLLDFIVGELGRTKVPPRKVCFEITETAALANLDEVLWLMQELKGMGCRFAIDDFGSGHASYAYVERLPVDHVKIDGAFVRDMLDNPVHRAIVESVHLIGRTLKIKTVAESVEISEVAQALTEIGIDAAQGWLYSKPAPLAEVCQAL